MNDAPELISIAQAAAAGIERVRRRLWARRLDHFKIDILEDGTVGPWLHLYAPANKVVNGRDPVDILWSIPPLVVDINWVMFVPYAGPLPESEEYQSAVAQLDRITR